MVSIERFYTIKMANFIKPVNYKRANQPRLKAVNTRGSTTGQCRHPSAPAPHTKEPGVDRQHIPVQQRLWDDHDLSHEQPDYGVDLHMGAEGLVRCRIELPGNLRSFTECDDRCQCSNETATTQKAPVPPGLSPRCPAAPHRQHHAAGRGRWCRDFVADYGSADARITMMPWTASMAGAACSSGTTAQKQGPRALKNH